MKLHFIPFITLLITSKIFAGENFFYCNSGKSAAQFENYSESYLVSSCQKFRSGLFQSPQTIADEKC